MLNSIEIPFADYDEYDYADYDDYDYDYDDYDYEDDYNHKWQCHWPV